MGDQGSALEQPAARGAGNLRLLVTSWVQQHLILIISVSAIVVWALFVGRDYLDFDPNLPPAGREYGSAIQAHHLWTRVKECGVCALWDGSERGGFPAFVDTLASSLHPLVALTTLAWGVVNGSKIALITTLAIAGLAQLWLGAELRLGWPARLWSALMVMVGGHLAGKMELGLFSIVLSTAMFSLTLPAGIRLARSARYRDAVILAVVLALLIVAGQGYIQAGFLLVSPAYLFLLWGSSGEMKQRIARFLLAAGLAILLAAPFLLPLAHFWPNFVKDGDPFLLAAQPLRFYLLNLVIDDLDFLFSSSLGKLPYPHLYTMFIGWIPLFLAALCLRFGRREDARQLLFLTATAVLAIFMGSLIPLRWLQPIFPAVGALRFGPMIGAMAVPALVGLAAYGLDSLLRANWPKPVISLGMSDQQSRSYTVELRWLLILPLFLAVSQGYRFSQQWLYLQEQDSETSVILDRLETVGLAWVQPPFGEHGFIEPAVRRGLKLSPGIMTWRWEGREFPEPVLEANRLGPPPNTIDVREGSGTPIYVRDSLPFAAVSEPAGSQVCLATGLGGYLHVSCNTSARGTLVVQENQWSGWYAWRDGERIPLVRSEQWLTVNAPAGEHVYEFRYLPWDVPLGILLAAIGCGGCAYFWRKPEPDRAVLE